mmetsp:Transcript_54362/g.168292  ORF Transcript_54362/g.168292 Transcript_54362/m.168292 type:complete len:532 (-) Transcript_54362:568-2163(-)
MGDLQDALEETAEARSALAVRNVGLGGRDDQGLLARCSAHDLLEGADLDRVAQGGARAVALEAVDLCRREVALAQHGVQALLLGWPVGRRQARAPAVLVGLASSKACQNLAVVHVLFDLEESGTAELAAGVAVRGGVEGEGPTLVAEHAGRAAAHEGAVVKHQVQAIDDGAGHRLEVFESQVQLRDVGADKGRRAGRVDGHASALQVQRVGEAVGRDSVGRGRCAVSPAEVEAACRAHAHPVVLVNAHEVADVLRLALQAPLVPTTFQESHVGHLHDLPLARVHTPGLCWGDLKELAVKQVHTFNAKAAVPGVGSAPDLVGVVIGRVVVTRKGDVRQTVCGCLANAVPELVLAVSPRAVAAVHRVHGALLARRWGRPSAEQAKHLCVTRHGAEDLVDRRLRKEKGREGQGLARGLVGVLVALGRDEDDRVRLCLEHDFLAALAQGAQFQGAVRRAGELQQREPLAGHGVQVALSVAVINVRGRVLVVLSVLERHAQEHVGAAVDVKTQRLLSVGSDHLADGPEVVVHNLQG